MIGTAIRIEGNIVTFLVKNDAACCNSGSGGCACGGSNPVYMKAEVPSRLDVQEGAMIEVQPRQSSWSGLFWVFILPLGLFVAGWNLSPLVFGINQPLQWGSGLVPAALAFLSNFLRPAKSALPEVQQVLPNFNLKDFTLPQ